MLHTFPFLDLPDDSTVSADSGFVGCRRTRKSKIDGVIRWGAGVLKTSSKTQATIAPGFAEAQLAAVVKGTTESLGMHAVFADFVYKVGISMFSDATTATGMVTREGLRRVRHLALGDLWVQQHFSSGDIKFAQIV